MSFTPLPTTFTDFHSTLDPSQARILELGVGDGRFRDLLAQAGLTAWGLDRIGPGGGTVADVVGDACAPPVADRSLDLLLAPNILRHLSAAVGSLHFVDRWRDLLKPGGFLFIFEDEPCDHPPGAAHYRDLQEFLVRLMPESRGPLISLEEFASRRRDECAAGDWESGRVRNRRAMDAGAVLEMLGAGRGLSGEPGRLLDAIGRDGLDPGHYWWARVGGKAVGRES